MDTSALEPSYGTYRVQPESTPRQRRIARRVAVIVLLVLVAWLVVQVSRGGVDAALPFVPVVVMAVAFGIISEVLQRRLGPWTRVRADGVVVASGLTGGRRRVAWADVRRLEAPQRFETCRVAVTSSGDRVELPGLPTAVAERISRELTTLYGDAAPPASTTAPPRTDGDDAWEGPFRRSGR